MFNNDNTESNNINRKRLSVISWNMRGMKTDHSIKCNQLQNFINKSAEIFDVICIQETHLTNKKQPFNFKGYQNPVSKIRNNNKGGGGLCIYVRNNIPFTEKQINQTENTEAIAVTLAGNKHPITIYNYYTPLAENNNIHTFQNIFNNLGRNTIITGDFNLKHTLWNPENDFRCDTEAWQLIDFLHENNLNCINDGQITRIGDSISHSDSAIDLAIISSHLHPDSEFNVIDNTFGSDHLPIITTIFTKYTSQTIKLTEKWKVHKASNEQWTKFREICRQELNYSITEQNIKENFQLFLNKLNEILAKTIPKSKTKTTKRRKICNWWNVNCTNIIKRRETLRKIFKRDRTPIKKELWHQARIEAKHIIQKAKTDSWIEFCSNITHKTNSKELWDFVNRIKGNTPRTTTIFKINNSTITDPLEQANILVNHYRNVSSNNGYTPEFTRLKTIRQDTIYRHLDTSENEHLNLPFNKDFSIFELELALKNCKNGAPGEDAIHYSILKQLPIESKHLLLQLFNQSWKTGSTPDSWSEAIIMPILKQNKDKHDPASYRPISLTSTFTKLMQKMIKPRLCNYLETNKLISKYQSGCRSNHSCEDNLTRLESDCKRAQASRKYLIAIFLDLSNAFDKLWNGGVLMYLKIIGINGRLLKWIGDFLRHRKIKVKQKGHTSEMIETINGCPQGSVLSPIIFSLFMNTLQIEIDKYNKSLRTPSERAELSQFVDDSATWVSSPKPLIAVKRAQNTLNTIEKWSQKYGFIINPTKTQVIIVQRRYSKIPESDPDFPKLELGGQKLTYNTTAKFLGMQFDKYLSWTTHINQLIIRCEKDLNVMRAIRGKGWGTSKKCLLTIYKALIISKIDYGSSVYATANDTALNKLQVIQNKALKLVTGCFKYTNTLPLLVETAELPLVLRRESNMLKYWARSNRLGDELPINDKLRVDTIYKAKCNAKKKHIKPPYSQTILKLLEEHELQNIEMAPPNYVQLTNIQTSKPDLELTEYISRSDPIPNKLFKAQTHIEDNYKEYIKYYTDGSKDQDKEITGAGIVGYDTNDQVIYNHIVKLPGHASIYTCELSAIHIALTNAWQSKHKKVAILSDSLSSLQSIDSGISKGRPEILNKILMLTNNIITKREGTVKFVWIPSHVGIYGNEHADYLAKEGSIKGKLNPMKLNISEAYSLIKTKIKNKFTKQWTEYNNTNFHNKCIYPTLPTQLEVYSSNVILDKIYTRLKLGKSLLKAERYIEDKKCPSCKELETFEHVFFTCKKYTSQRQNLEADLLNMGIIIINKETLLNPPMPFKDKIRKVLFNYITNTGLIKEL